MTYDTFKFFESEVEELVTKVLDAVKIKSFPNYCLLLAYAGYQYENEGTDSSPYVIHSRLEINQDITRQKFLAMYLDQYTCFLIENIFMTNEYREYDLNIQMMIYSQVWESHLFLKTLKRIADVLNGKPYEWKVPFEVPGRKDPSKIVSIPKAKFIQEQIIIPLQTGHEELYKFLKFIYDSQLRNDFAHASYYLDFECGEILSQDSERYFFSFFFHFNDWEDRFIYTVMLSYHLSKAIHDRMDSFLADNPEIKEVTIKYPLYNESEKTIDLPIYPQKLEVGVEFSF